MRGTRTTFSTAVFHSYMKVRLFGLHPFACDRIRTRFFPTIYIAMDVSPHSMFNISKTSKASMQPGKGAEIVSIGGTPEMHTQEVNEDIYTICNKQSVRRGRERNKLHTGGPRIWVCGSSRPQV